MAEKQGASAGKKRKRNETNAGKKCAEKSTTDGESKGNKKKRCISKAMSKKMREDLSKSLQCLEPKMLVEEMKRDVEEHFGDGHLCGFLEALFENKEPMLEIARHHRDSFVMLYGECKALKNSCMEFQRHWHAHCSAFLLEEKYTLADINLKESDNGYTSIVARRNLWIEFCKEHNTPVPESNPVMIMISSRAYFYLLDQVALYQNELSAANEPTDELVSNGDSDDVYYRFGGATICTMLKHRYKGIRNCSTDTRNSLSLEICLLQAMKMKDKSSIPEYLQFRDKGYMYFPESSLIPFFRKFDGVLKQVVNDDGFRKHGDSLIKVKSLKHVQIL